MKSHAEKTTSADKSIGFDYQYYYFLYRVLKLGKNESVGLEVKDDVHSDLDNDHQLLVQVKHTVKRRADGKAKNLTTFDSDLWKTLSNWSKVISDETVGRGTIEEQFDFILKSEFMLVTNKSYNNRCEFFSILSEIKGAKERIEHLKSKTEDKIITDYINDVLALDDNVLERFLDKVRLELEVDEIIERCKDAIVEHHVDQKRVEQLFRDLDSRIRQDNFITIRSGEKIVITFKDFHEKYRRYFDIARSVDLKISQYHKELPAKLEEQTFIKQLVDIGDIELTDIGEMAKFTASLLTVQSNVARWLQEGELTSEEIDEFDREATLRWENKFRSVYRRAKNKDIEELALEVLDEMRQQILNIGDQQLGTDFSNGEYYLLSDYPKIGWQKNWDSKYK
ncbi:MAG: ABC-three component system protein [Candidatus Electrothrix aestuarii]|uniref:ABC-three component system protein n=1 Tax=Candidatus Electrothrix aestuarii TaxID=3062594 RepID=A0AAU8LQK7_9BACT|nr:hypothetical protein [Candidatus Electrothrix aestuarii]